ncbi:hypothetical protein QEN19_002535 [Hanseniaspora menglaensis]
MATGEIFLKSLSIPINKKLVRLDIHESKLTEQDAESKHIILSEGNNSIKTDMYDVFQYDYSSTINFENKSTLTYYLINNFTGILCKLNGTSINVFIHIPEHLAIYNHNYKNFKVFFDHVNHMFVFDLILSDKSFLNINAAINIFNSTGSGNSSTASVKYTIIQSTVEHQYVPISLYQLNNHLNLITLEDGGLILSSKLKEDDLVTEYRNKIYGKTEIKRGLRSLFFPFKSETSNNVIIENTDYLKDLITSVILLPENKLILLTDKLDFILLQLTGFDSQLSELPEESLTLELLDKINVLESFVPEWKTGSLNKFSETRVQVNYEFSKFVFYLPNLSGNYLLAELNYDIQSIESTNLGKSLSGFKYLEVESERFTTLNNDFYFVDYKIDNKNDIHCLLKSKSLSITTKNEFIVMKFSNGKWTTTFQDQISKVNHIEQLDSIDLSTLNKQQLLDLSIAFEFYYGVNHKQLFDEKNNFIYKSNAEWIDFVALLKKDHVEKLGEPCGLSFSNSESGLLTVNLKSYNQFGCNILPCYLPAFKLPFEDHNNFFKMIKDVCNSFTISEDSLSIYQLIRECIKKDTDEINVDLLKSKYGLINIQEFVLFLNSTKIENIIASLETLLSYDVDINITANSINYDRQNDILLDYVYYKNSQLMNLYLNIILCFRYVDINNADLVSILKKLVTLLKKRFKFDTCYKFNKSAILNIFIAQNKKLNLARVENLVVASEFLVHNTLINDFDSWNLKYQLYHLETGNLAHYKLQSFIDYVLSFEYNAKIKNIALLNSFNFESAVENCYFENKHFEVEGNFDFKISKLLKTNTNFEYLTCLFTIFIDQYKELKLSNILAKNIVERYISKNPENADKKTQLIFYKYYIKLISEDGKYMEILNILLTTDSLLEYEDKFEIFNELFSRFDIQFLKTIIQFNYNSTELILPFNQFDIIKQIVFNEIKNEKKKFTLLDYVKLLLSYDDKRGAMKILYYLMTEEDAETDQSKSNYKIMLVSLLYTLPKADRWVISYSGVTVSMDEILNI